MSDETIVCILILILSLLLVIFNLVIIHMLWRKTSSYDIKRGRTACSLHHISSNDDRLNQKQQKIMDNIETYIDSILELKAFHRRKSEADTAYRQAIDDVIDLIMDEEEEEDVPKKG